MKHYNCLDARLLDDLPENEVTVFYRDILKKLNKHGIKSVSFREFDIIIDEDNFELFESLVPTLIKWSNDFLNAVMDDINDFDDLGTRFAYFMLKQILVTQTLQLVTEIEKARYVKIDGSYTVRIRALLLAILCCYNDEFKKRYLILLTRQNPKVITNISNIEGICDELVQLIGDITIDCNKMVKIPDFLKCEEKECAFDDLMLKLSDYTTQVTDAWVFDVIDLVEYNRKIAPIQEIDFRSL